MESTISVRSEARALAIPCITRFIGNAYITRFIGNALYISWTYASLWQERIHLDLRLLSGERRHGSSRAIAKSYEELQQAFLEVPNLGH